MERKEILGRPPLRIIHKFPLNIPKRRCKGKKNTNRKVEYHYLHWKKQDNWIEGFPRLGEEEQGYLHTIFGAVKNDVHEEVNNTEVKFSENH